ncbi:epsin-1 isoform X1 [Xiphias gladius]|uniref:epsin-1 isoform X1 n=1 Tax=Xiphias gladius TaxID=8245 RepID=UPI001A99500E|nr:epsin-1 isoform X1 [Xiphias gladius]XP_039977294.1 epsin-1 isoform X1 [Xiphias gladius]XP_039977295.1 epsin-1 isoform X1 [Xiphias gladius]XP_039977296.1 epsin-1 isoform X1 [Xiphias gladius]XP_039977297.1 epsin-1 isoform X1 [Xiphias gladius]
MTSSMLRRQLKNLVQNYSEAEVKVREATSNDPWGPSSSQMADISDLTYNVVACNEIMTMLWKRLKDDKNWRHIHKSLTLLEYLLKTGDDRVLLKMKDNIYIVKALTEYRFVEKDGKDQGVNVREKAKVVLVLMEDDEKLKEERDFAVKTREKTSKSSAASSSDTIKDPRYRPCYVPGATGLPSLDNIPSVADLTASFAARKEERLKQEAEKKEAERRAKMSEDELKWEDACKGNDVKVDAWGGEKAEEEAKPDPWGAPKEPKEATDPWGTPTRPDTTDTAGSSDPWGAQTTADKDPFAAPKTDEDPFVSAKTGEDPFAVPKNGEDPFVAGKEGPDPFSASKDDPFNAPKDSSDPFNATKDKEDPFAAPNDKADPFGSSNNDPFNTPKDDPFNVPKDDPFNTTKDDPFNNPKDDPFNTPKDDPFNAPKDDPFNTAKDDPFNAPKDDPFNTPKDDPFNATKDDPFNTPKDDPFTAPASTPPKEDPFAAPMSSKDDHFSAPTTKNDPFSAPTKPAQEDPFAAPTTPPKEDPFSTTSNHIKDDPFVAPTTPPKEDPFAVPSSAPQNDASDPFNAPSVRSPQGSADAWGAPASSPPATGSDPWGTPSAPKETKRGDPWGDGASASSPTDNSDPFGDVSKPDNDPWGASASAPASADDAWGSPAPPSDSSPSSDPFGDGASKTSDPWGAPSNATSSATGKRTAQEEEMYRKTASFLGSAGASLVDLDDLFSSNPKPKQRPLINTLAAQTQAMGIFKARGMSSGPVVSSGAVGGVSLPETSGLPGSPFGYTLAPPHGAPFPTSGAANPSRQTPLFQLPSHTMEVSYSGFSMLQAAQVAPEIGIVQPDSVGWSPQTPCEGVGMVQTGNPVGNLLAEPLLWGRGMGQSSFFGGNLQARVGHLGGSSQQAGGGVPLQPQLLSSSGLGEPASKNNNPFLF